MEHQLTVVGIGPGSPDYILPAAIRQIETAQVLVGGRRALEAFAIAGQKQIPVSGDIAALLQEVRRELQAADVVVMVSGDPGYYSLLETFRREMPEQPIRVIPGISSFQLAFARIGQPWQNVRLLSAHGRQPDPADLLYQPGLALSFLTDGQNSPARIAGWLLAKGWSAHSKVWLCRNLSYPDEMVCLFTLAEVETVSGFDSCVMVVME